MITTLLVTQGGLAEELYQAGCRIAGALPNFHTLSLDWSDDLVTARGKVRARLDAISADDGVLILVDMHGSTPCNAALSLYEAGRIEILTGVNLPMVVRLGCLTAPLTTLQEATEWLKGKGQKSICRARGRLSAAAAAAELGPCDPSPVGEAPAGEEIVSLVGATDRDEG